MVVSTRFNSDMEHIIWFAASVIESINSVNDNIEYAIGCIDTVIGVLIM